MIINLTEYETVKESGSILSDIKVTAEYIQSLSSAMNIEVRKRIAKDYRTQ